MKPIHTALTVLFCACVLAGAGGCKGVVRDGDGNDCETTSGGDEARCTTGSATTGGDESSAADTGSDAASTGTTGGDPAATGTTG